MTTAIDLSLLPTPDVLEEIDYETLLQQRKNALLERFSGDKRAEIEETLALESEPLVKQLQENAYREMLLRQRINVAAKSVMLAYAAGADLDHIGANYGVERLTISEGDSSANPPIPPVMESDGEFRRRIQLSPEGYTTAGSRQSYIFHALSADADVLDSDAVMSAPGSVTVYVLSRTGDGTAPAQTLAAVETAINAEMVRPMTDQVTVQSALIVNYAIEAELTVYPGPDAAVVKEAAEKAVASFIAAQHAMSRDVNLSGIYAALHQPGVQNVNLASPLANMEIGDGEASHCTDVTITLAEETDV